MAFVESGNEEGAEIGEPVIELPLVYDDDQAALLRQQIARTNERLEAFAITGAGIAGLLALYIVLGR